MKYKKYGTGREAGETVDELNITLYNIIPSEKESQDVTAFISWFLKLWYAYH
jgi:hypothetical protein